MWVHLDISLHFRDLFKAGAWVSFVMSRSSDYNLRFWCFGSWGGYPMGTRAKKRKNEGWGETWIQVWARTIRRRVNISYAQLILANTKNMASRRETELIEFSNESSHIKWMGCAWNLSRSQRVVSFVSVAKRVVVIGNKSYKEQSSIELVLWQYWHSRLEEKYVAWLTG